MRQSSLIALVATLLLAAGAAAQEGPRAPAAVEIDGTTLFRVRGIDAYPAATRAADIESRVATLARDRSFRPETLQVEDRGAISYIAAGPLVVMALDDEDARIEGVQRSVLVQGYALRVRRAIIEYREARAPAR